jgi:hypothetical protein
MNRKRGVLLAGAFVLLAGGVAYWRLTSAPPAPPDDTGPIRPTPDAAGAGSAEEKARRQLLGVWQDDYQGKRTMTLKEDGAGTMLVELSGLQATLFAPRLRFDLRWSLDGKTFTKKTVGGEPAGKVNVILNTMGNTAEDTVLEVTPDRLLLLDKDGKTRYDWKRIKKDEPADH